MLCDTFTFFLALLLLLVLLLQVKFHGVLLEALDEGGRMFLGLAAQLLHTGRGARFGH